jgi:hypothetical protein
MNAAMDIRDVRPPIDVPGIPLWVWLIVLFLAAAAAGYVYWKKRHARVQAVVLPQTSWEIAYGRLAELEARDFFGQGKVKEYFSTLSTIIRRYIEDRFNIHAPDMTTEEFLNSVKANPFIEEKHKEILRQFLNLSDMVKFAKYGPNPSEAKDSFALAKRFVDETKGEEEPAPQKTL